MSFRCASWLFVVLTFLAVGPEFVRGEDPPAKLDFEKNIQPFLNDYCGACHNADDKMGDLVLDEFESVDSVTTQRDTWLKMVGVLKGKDMPPDGELQPSDEERAAVIGWMLVPRLTARRRPRSFAKISQRPC